MLKNYVKKTTIIYIRGFALIRALRLLVVHFPNNVKNFETNS